MLSEIFFASFKYFFLVETSGVISFIMLKLTYLGPMGSERAFLNSRKERIEIDKMRMRSKYSDEYNFQKLNIN